MSKIAIVADSNSGYTQEEAKEAGISLIPMPFYVDGKEYFEGINLGYEEFFGFLKQDADVSTSTFPGKYSVFVGRAFGNS